MSPHTFASTVIIVIGMIGTGLFFHAPFLGFGLLFLAAYVAHQVLHRR